MVDILIGEKEIRSILSNFVVKVRESLMSKGCFYVTLSNIKGQSWDDCSFNFDKEIIINFDCRKMSKNHYLIDTNNIESWKTANNQGLNICNSSKVSPNSA